MKRKDDERVSGGPMFPRLHVNDTDKGGPRAPPRNKMALYEQLSIPSQRFNRGALPVNPNSNSNSNNNNNNNKAHPASAGQGTGLGRNTFSRLHPPSSRNTRMDEESSARQSNDSNLNAPYAQLEQRDKVGEENDFQVPIFVHSGRGQDQGSTQNGGDRETLRPLRSSYSVISTKLQSTSMKDAKQISSHDHNLRQDVRGQSQENSYECMSNMEHSAKSARRKMNEPSMEANYLLYAEHQDRVANLSRLQEIDASSQHERGSRPESEDTERGGIEELTRYVQTESNPRYGNDSHSRGADCSEPADGGYLRDQTFGSCTQPGTDAEKSDDVSETSMVDSISGMDISPDDIVGMIGQKRFWKARRAIVNQQRVFAVQLFELHRLIKVQKLIAGAPHLLHDDSAYLGKSSLTGSPVKKLPEYIPRPPLIVKRKVDLEKANNKKEHSAENAIGRDPVSTKNGTQPPSYGPNMAPLCFPQASGHQWLVPVMTPSEGLVYKPYPGPGFMEAGCGAFGPVPFSGNFMNPGHGYFPPYVMPVMNTGMSGVSVEQMNQFAGPVPIPHGHQMGQPLLQHQSSCSVPTQKSGSIPQARKVQGSTASSPSERTRGIGTGQGAQGRDVASAVTQAVPQVGDNNVQMTRVIRVVPHNPRSATESAARIFQSIQEERKQFDSD